MLENLLKTLDKVLEEKDKKIEMLEWASDNYKKKYEEMLKENELLNKELAQLRGK